MGRRGPLRDPDAHGHHHPEVVELVTSIPGMEVPDPPGGLLKVTEADWFAFWESPVAAATSAVDLPALRRLFTYRDELTRAMNAVRKSRQRVVEGSRGQATLHPLLAHVQHMEQAVARLETECGCTPMSRARLGVQVGAAKLTAAELNKQALEANEEVIEVDGYETT